ncbi:asparagine synthase-related protein [Streptomyces sp. NPDC008001]|uniref:asparagine synthase-related protein n=1 Tax=Streptomyces sp. NPDC008001 TaxID=3364804 RepID=UPI0036E89719
MAGDQRSAGDQRFAGDERFAILPDGEPSSLAAELLRPSATEVIRHASGRPWLLGSWPAGRVRTAEAGSARLAVIGRCRVTAAGLAAGLRRIRRAEDVEQAVRGLPGCFHAVASIGGTVAVRGTASGTRRVYSARVGGATIGASGSGVLAAVTGARVDEEALALHLLSSPPLYPLDDHCVWHGVQAVRSHDCLLLERDGRARTRRWWTPPEPVVPAVEGAHDVRRALEDAVGSCTAGGGTISSDLSGGPDSTSLCFLAARSDARLVTLHWSGLDPGNDDSAFAARAAAELPGAGHVVVDRSRAPAWYTPPAGTDAVADEPGPWVRDAARLSMLAALMTGRGSRLHMTGGGGDELFTAHPAYLHDYLRSNPLAALARLRRQHAFQRTPVGPLLRGLADRSTFAQWLAGWTAAVSEPAPARSPAGYVPSLSWGPEQHMPPWATRDAARSVRVALREAAAAGPEPLAPQRGQHGALVAVIAGGRGLRQMNQVISGMGPEYAAPFLDDGVVEAALSVRVAERNAPDRYKPVLASALRGIVPRFVLNRSTKGEYSAGLHTGLRVNRAALAGLFGDSDCLLARLGLIDAGVLRRELSALRPAPDPHFSLDFTLGAELWLRAHRHEAGHPRPVSTGGPS